MAHHRAEEIRCDNTVDALVETIAFILKCLKEGGVPISRGTFVEDGYLGRTWICYGKADEVRSVRIYAPASNIMWRELNRLLDQTYGDWKYVLTRFSHLLDMVIAKYPDLADIASKVKEAIEGKVAVAAPVITPARVRARLRVGLGVRV